MNLNLKLNVTVNEEDARRLYVGIMLNGLCKESSAISYKIWHRKEEKNDGKIEREELLLSIGAKWKKEIHPASRFSFSSLFVCFWF